MLKQMRSNVKKLHWILWILILTFVLWGVGSLGQMSSIPSNVIERIDDISVTMNDYIFAYNRMVSFYKQMYGDRFTPEMVEQMGIRQSALQGVIEEGEKAALAVRSGFDASDTEVKDEIINMDGLKDKDGRFIGADRYRAVLKANNMTTSEFESGVRQTLLIKKLENSVQDALIPCPADARVKYRFDNTKRSFEYLLIESKNFEDDVTFQDKDLQAFFNDNKESYRVGEKRSIQYVVFRARDFEGEVENEESLLKEYYESHIEDYKEAEKVMAAHILLKTENMSPDQEKAVLEKIKDIRSQLEQGANFATLAKEYSQDPGSKDKGGDLGYFGRGQMVPPFEEAAFTLKVGELSQPVKTRFGYHLILVRDKRAAHTKSFAQVRNQVDAKLKAIKAEKLAMQAVKAFHQAALDGDFAKVAEEKKLEIKTTKPFGQGKALPDLGYAPELAEAAFALKKGAVSPIVKTRNSYYVCRLDTIEPSHIPEWSDEAVKGKLETNYRKEYARELAKAKAEALLAELEAGKTFAAVVADNEAKNISSKVTPPATVNGNFIGISDVEGKEALFRLPQGAYYGPVDFQEDSQFLIYQLKEETTPDTGKMADALPGIKESLERTRGRAFFRSWFGLAKDQLSVEQNTELVKYLLRK